MPTLHHPKSPRTPRERASSQGPLWADTAFDSLMQQRVLNILLVCSQYDAFLLQEDGRVEEQIFNEYIALNQRYPPKFFQVSSAQEAHTLLRIQNIDLVILMINVKGVDPFALARDIKVKHPDRPIVVLTPFSRDVLLRVHREDLSPINHVFSWLGNASIMLAIIKLVEDSMNAPHDILTGGVQALLLVEDSIRFYSSYLPIIYRIILAQSQGYMVEGLNEHQKMLRMRGRPKILLAKNLEQAFGLYQTYRDNLLGVITDVSYPYNGAMEPGAGFILIDRIQDETPLMPILVQSSDRRNGERAEALGVGFLHKHSKTIAHDIAAYLREHFAFGDLVFRDPLTGQEANRAQDLKSLQEVIFQVPDHLFEHHLRQGHIARWLNARALFPIAQLFTRANPSDFSDRDQLRRFLFDGIDRYRSTKGQGIIASFTRDRYDTYQIFSRIGAGSLGGKGRGLAFVDSLIKRHNLMSAFEGVTISIPRTVVICTDVFDEFMERNQLYPVALSDAPNEEILRHFLGGGLPARIHKDLLAFLGVVRNPIAVRSSSLLEDALFQPFAGIYSTYMLPNTPGDTQRMLAMVSQAIKGVYASVYFKESKAYMLATRCMVASEHMAVQLQELVGARYGPCFYPAISGVGRSVNFYPIPPETPADGIVSIALGLGRHVVDGRPALRFSPRYPRKAFQLSSPEVALRDTQKTFFALDLDPNRFQPSTDDGENLLELDIREALAHGPLAPLASTYDMDSKQIRDGHWPEGIPIVSFASILKHRQLPLPEILSALLQVGQSAMNNPVEIEFAVNLPPPKGTPPLFAMLQIRPMVQPYGVTGAVMQRYDEARVLLRSPLALGNGRIDGIRDIVYVKPERFQPSQSRGIASEIERVNARLVEQQRAFILIGPGRWGSSDPWLGIPVSWSQISAAKVIVEAGLQNFRVDPSQGTHFFQNLTAFGVGYLTINPHINQGQIDYHHLGQLPAAHDGPMVRHVQSAQQFTVLIDGRARVGVILKD